MEITKDVYKEVENRFIRENKLRELWKEVMKMEEIDEQVITELESIVALMVSKYEVDEDVDNKHKNK